MSANKRVALAVFAKTPGLSPVKTRLAKKFGSFNAEKFYALSLSCIEAAARAALQSEPALQPYWALADSGPAPEGFQRIAQGEGGLGERLSRVYLELLQTHQAVIIIGTDSPQLTPDMLISACGKVSDNPEAIVIGPAEDGGFYLFASGVKISPERWTRVEYSKSHTCERLVEELTGCGKLELADRSFDIDEPKGLDRLRGHWSEYPPELPEQTKLRDWLSDSPGPVLSVVIPALQEELAIGDTLRAAKLLDAVKEIIVIDGGSTDRTVSIAREHGAMVVNTPRGRGAQLQRGGLVATGETLLFLHADTIPPPRTYQEIFSALSRPEVAAGTFLPTFSGATGAARFLSWLYPHLRYIGLSYGDAGLFTRRSAYEQVGGFRSLPIFEDLDFLRRIKKAGKFVRLETRLVTSARRFEGRSFVLTFLWWTMLQVLYWLRVPPSRLAPLYAHIREPRKSR